MKNLWSRLASGLVYVGIIVFGTTGSPWLFAGLMALLMILCLIEFVKITEFSKLYAGLAFLASIGVFYYFTYYLFQQQNAFVANSLSFAGPVLFVLAVYTIMFSTNELKIDFGKLTIGVVYCAVPFALALTIPTTFLEFGKTVVSREILYIFALIWISDVMAYVVGSLWGKHKMSPKISEKKSWEGLIGGIVFTIIAGFIFQKYFSTDDRVNWIIIGLIVAVFAPLGDLVESKLKRTFDVKDSGKLMPGHGGFLDRLDSFLFVIPMVYLYLLLNQIL